jgi:hypothetical protein
MQRNAHICQIECQLRVDEKFGQDDSRTLFHYSQLYRQLGDK